MDEEDFDVIVVGAGIAGAVASYLLSNSGRSVLLIERGENPGEKNLSGGVFYCRILEEIFPNFIKEAPVERQIVRHSTMLLNQQNHVTIDYRDQRLVENGNAVSVLRSKLDKWLVEQAEAAGTMFVPGMKVDQLLVENNRVVGVRIGEDEMRAKVTVVADGVNSFLAIESGLREKAQPRHQAVGIKSVIRLAEKEINQRFQLESNEGAAFAVVGDCTAGVGGGGFLYTNRDSISIGVVVRLDDLVASGKSASELHDRFLKHPLIAPYLKDGEAIEYGSHLVAEGGYKEMGKIVHDGAILLGDAAGMTINTGLTVRGMDLAAGSAIAAARAIDEAIAQGDTSAQRLGKYQEYLAASATGKDLKTYQDAPEYLMNPELYGQLGELAADLFYRVFHHDLQPRQKLWKVTWNAIKASQIKKWRLVSLLWGGKSL